MECIIQKKRGRKPKLLIKHESENNLDQIEKVKEIKRRGRKPTCKIYENKPFDEEQFTNMQESECILVHLPITKKDIIDDKNINLDGNVNEIVIIDNPVNKTVNTLYNVNNVNNVCERCKEYDVCLKELKTIKNQLLFRDIDKKILQSSIKLENIYNGQNLWEYENNIYCRWCLHKFNTLPIGLPESYINKVYYIINCYCSFNCALAHNLTFNDYNMLHRTSLLYHMRNNIFSLANEKIDDQILPAPPQEMLYIFNGPLNIDDFRNASIVFKKQYIQHLSVISIDKIFEDNSNATTKPKYNKSHTSEYVLSRNNNPINNKN